MDSIKDTYCNQIHEYELLTPEREKELSFIIQNSESSEEVSRAREEFILANLRLVVKFAQEIHSSVCIPNNIKISFLDLVSEGNIGLVRAVELFNAEKFDNKFSTYASNAIRRRMMKAIKQTRFIRVPEKHVKWQIQLKKLQEEHGESLTDEMILEELGIAAKTLEILRNENKHTVIDGVDVEDVLEKISSEDSTHDMYKIITAHEEREYLMSEIDELPDIQKDIIKRRFFEGRFVGIKELAAEHGVSRQAIDQAERRAFKKLKSKIMADRTKERLAQTPKPKKSESILIQEMEKKKNKRT